MKFKKTLAMALAAVVATSAFCVNVMAAEEGGLKKPGEAGIDFKKGGTTIEPTPDGDLDGISDTNIYFGIQEISGSTEEYDSTDTHDDPDREHAGFIVNARNDDGWKVNVQITSFAFKESGAATMKNFKLNLIPEGGVQTTEENESNQPAANTVNLFGGADRENPGNSATIFEAEDGDGLGKWGCNWKGILSVPGGSVAETGTATATMLWTLVPLVEI